VYLEKIMTCICTDLLQEPSYPPQGALAQDDGSVVWRVWAPFAKSVSLVTLAAAAGDGQNNRVRREIAMTPEEFGYFSHQQADVPEGLRYYYRLDDGREYPDPAARWQPEGVHDPSAVFFPAAYRWHDDHWRGVAREDLVIYELHVGTFTPEGTFEAIIPRLKELREFGITALEIMPVAQFPGQRDWGYDGAYCYAAQNSYGGPHALQRLVDAAHQAGMGMILDVVYNHFGPEGSYAGKFGPYYTNRHHTPWGNAINYDGPECDPVRRFVIDNARMWVRDFHFDGLRLDAVQTIFDLSAAPILAEVQTEVQEEAARQNRTVHVIAETNQNDARQLLPAEGGGYGLSGVWSDDFHHSLHALLTGERDGYYADFGLPELLVKAFNHVFVHDGGYSRFHRRRRGSRVDHLDRTHFIQAIQNHDQIGNRALGDRLGTIVAPETQRLAAALLMLSPCVPLLFMGEEYGETHPFPFFCSFGDPDLVEAVCRGRRREFADLAFKWKIEIPDPQAVETFESAKLTWSWPEGSHHAKLRRLYQDLLAARREWPALRDRRHCRASLRDGLKTSAEISDEHTAVLILERGEKDASLTAVANLSPHELIFPDLPLDGQPMKFCTEDARYGGRAPANRQWERLYPYELVIL
jgi:maltooligosyltrehalose trehalohydrolase